VFAGGSEFEHGVLLGSARSTGEKLGRRTRGSKTITPGIRRAILRPKCRHATAALKTHVRAR
jgi:hypothetical protein